MLGLHIVYTRMRCKVQLRFGGNTVQWAQRGIGHLMKRILISAGGRRNNPYNGAVNHGMRTEPTRASFMHSRVPRKTLEWKGVLMRGSGSRNGGILVGSASGARGRDDSPCGLRLHSPTVARMKVVQTPVVRSRYCIGRGDCDWIRERKEAVGKRTRRHCALWQVLRP
mmetsp:Transcript_38573/g.115779  ORF Transcript_38573/g.115779 Transcript_38573/m.115779 type:complete len:168 (-) Transcript_38573:1150-1653(-)